MTLLQNRTAMIHAGDVVIDLAAREVHRRSVVCKLEPQAAAVLAELIAANGEVRDRQTLIDRCWTDDSGSDESLSQAISQLRRALCDDFRKPRFIATVHKTGYRWLAPKPVSNAVPERRSPIYARFGRARIALAGAGIGAIAVAALLFANASPAPDRGRLEIRKMVLRNGGKLHQTVELRGDSRAVSKEATRLQSEVTQAP
jgi:DNA-binding winged helix-turn-helix (wHTH) protein